MDVGVSDVFFHAIETASAPFHIEEKNYEISPRSVIFCSHLGEFKRPRRCSTVIWIHTRATYTILSMTCQYE